MDSITNDSTYTVEPSASTTDVIHKTKFSLANNTYKRSKWKNDDEIKLKNTLASGTTLPKLQLIFPSRSEDSLIRRASMFGYGYKTTNGVKIFYDGIKHIDRRTKEQLIADGYYDNKVDTSSQDVAIESSAIKPIITSDLNQNLPVVEEYIMYPIFDTIILPWENNRASI